MIAASVVCDRCMTVCATRVLYNFEWRLILVVVLLVRPFYWANDSPSLASAGGGPVSNSSFCYRPNCCDTLDAVQLLSW